MDWYIADLHQFYYRCRRSPSWLYLKRYEFNNPRFYDRWAVLELRKSLPADVVQWRVKNIVTNENKQHVLEYGSHYYWL